MTVIKAMWIGETSGVVIPDLQITVQRNQPFTTTDEWLNDRLSFEPHRWKRATDADEKNWLDEERRRLAALPEGIAAAKKEEERQALARRAAKAGGSAPEKTETT